MSQKYYDSAFTGAQIDAAVRTAEDIANASNPVNNGKYIAVNEEGKLQAVDPPQSNPYDDTELRGRIETIENVINNLIPANGEVF